MACLFAILLELPIALAYVWMATAMPRSGGDYVFQSRVLGGAIGFPVVMSGFVIWILQWVALAGWLLAYLGVAPLFMGLGVYYDSASLIDAAVWAQSPQGKVIISIVGAAAMAALLSRRLQELRAPAVLHVCRDRPPGHHPAGAVPAHVAGAVRDGDEPLLQRRRWPHRLLPVGPEGRRRRRRQPPAQVRPRRHAAGRADRVDQPAVGHLQRGAGRRDQGRPRLQEPDVHHRRFHGRHGRHPRRPRVGRGEGCGHGLLQRRVQLLLLRGTAPPATGFGSVLPFPGISPS